MSIRLHASHESFFRKYTSEVDFYYQASVRHLPSSFIQN